MSSTTWSPAVQSQSFDSWVARCQILVGGPGLDARVTGDMLLDLAGSLPDDLTEQEQERAGQLLARLFCRFVSALDRRMVSDLACRALTGDAVGEWLTATHRLAGLVLRAPAPPPAVPPRQGPVRADGRVERALAEIDRHFANPRFGLRAAAHRVALSDCRLTQLIKAATGRTFGAHLHHRRIAEARALLNDPALSIKEVANRVGYESTTQLDRHFKKIERSLPSAYRASQRLRNP
jgi:AraC-like DNA-binding protein